MNIISGQEGLGILLAVGLVFVIAAALLRSRLEPPLKRLAMAGLAVHVLGALGYYVLTQGLYGGGDYGLYFSRGWEYAQRLWEFDAAMFVDPAEWRGGKWWGTQFVCLIAGIVLAVLGPSQLGGFVVFSLMGFLGLVAFGLAFGRAFPGVPVIRYLPWIWLFPSLWFWPSAMGKEAVLLMGLGLTVLGYVGKDGRVGWWLCALGVFFVFGVRPQVAAVVVTCLVLGMILSQEGGWTPWRAVQAVILVAGGLAVVSFSFDYVGIESMDAQGVSNYFEEHAAGADYGGSYIEGVTGSWANVPMALVNILFRPFPWEAHNVMALVAAVEIWGFWVLAWCRRRNIVNAVRHWQSNRLLAVALSFTLLYSVALGLLMANMGIIVRQRIFLFPFLFLLFEAVPRTKMASTRAPTSMPNPFERTRLNVESRPYPSSRV